MTTDSIERKSELRLALERALFRRSKPTTDGEAHWGLEKATRAQNGRWSGAAWFRDPSGHVVRVAASGSALLGAAEALLERT